jgi:hypothetical protein
MAYIASVSWLRTSYAKFLEEKKSLDTLSYRAEIQGIVP